MATTQHSDPEFIDDEAEEEPGAVEEVIREVIAGDKRGAVRRIVLYVLAGVLVVSPVPQAAVIPLLLLGLTDQLL